MIPFTIDLLLGAGVNARFYVLLIPMLWSLMGLWAAISLGMYEDLGLAVSGLSAAGTMLPVRAGFRKLTAYGLCVLRDFNRWLEHELNRHEQLRVVNV